MNYVVIGAGFGDEGKGQTVSDIIKNEPYLFDCVVRFNGGQQAGHTVEHNGIRHVFSNFGSGTLQGKPTYWSKFCTFDPCTTRKEAEMIESYGIIPALIIDPLCPVTLPWDILKNRETNKDGTVGAGFGVTLQRNEDNFKLFARDLLTPSILRTRLNQIKDYYYKEDVDFEQFVEDVEWLKSTFHITIGRPKFNSYLFEGAQGILLDQDFGFFPNVTRSKTTPFNAIEVARDLGVKIDKVFYVSRYYHTRHGKGPFIKEKIQLKDNIKETNVLNQFQGAFKIAPLNLDWLKYAIEMSSAENSLPFNLVLTCEDHLIDPEKVPVIIEGVLVTMSTKEIREHLIKSGVRCDKDNKLLF